jgi:reprolysin-like metallo-peptidase family M12B/type IX secretion system substrate protein/fibronectin type III domain protein/pre-peptidase
MRRFILLALLSALISTSALSQADKFWSANHDNRSDIAKDKAVARLSYPKEFKLFNLNAPPFRQELFSIVGANRSNPSTIISIPNADGNLEEFEVVEASNFEPDLQAQFPGIRAYTGKGITDKYAILKLSISPQGVQTMVLRADKDDEFIEPYSQDHSVYSVYRAQRDKGKLPWNCSTDDKQMASDVTSKVSAQSVAAGGSSVGQLKTLRLVQSCNGEYANYFGATSASDVAKVLDAFNATLTRCNGVFEKDLGVHLNLIANTTAVIYYNPSTDPYTNLSSWNLQLQRTLTSVIGSPNYDIGHMFGATGGGGNAGCIGCVCVDPANNNSLAKGSGITSPADGIPQGDNFDIDYVIHEMGHQLGANHTFSMSNEGTGAQMEVGSGITIMGYAGITSYDVAPHSIDIFHEVSIKQIQTNLATKTCPVSTDVTANNVPPVVAAVSNYTIPISTPFALTGSATDANGDALTYCWEQNDNSSTTGSGSVASPTKTTGPNWLSFKPTASPTRMFPKLSTILSGLMVTPPLAGGDAGANIEALSSVSRTLNFRLTVRDNHVYSSAPPVSVGQTAYTDMVVTVTNTAGPFQVTAPNTNVTWNAGSTATVTWAVNGTNAGSVNCSSVKISLSTDGGNTFPTVLLASTPNDGSEVVTVPNITGTTNRIKVEAVGNIFFDISNSNFTIAAASCGTPTGLTSSSITQNTATVSWTAVSGAVSYDVDYKDASSGTWINAATATTSTSVNLSNLIAGTSYDWRVRTNCSSASSGYASTQFTTIATATCDPPTGLTALSITQTGATVSWTAVSGATSYDVDYKATSSGTWSNAATGTTSTSVNISGLTANTTYDWRVRAICTSGAGSYVQSQFTTAAGSVTCPGPYDVSTNVSTVNAPAIPLNTDVNGLIEARGDNDYYRFDITTGGSITITLTTLPADYQLALLNSSGATMQSSLNNSTTNETISTTVAIGTYYVRVYPKSNGAFNATSCYTLRVQTGTASRNAETMLYVGNKLTVSPNPTAHFVNLAFNIPVGGKATLCVINQTGAMVLQKTLTVNAGENLRNLDVSNLASGMYFIRLQAGSVTQMAKLVVAK